MQKNANYGELLKQYNPQYKAMALKIYRARKVAHGKKTMGDKNFYIYTNKAMTEKQSRNGYDIPAPRTIPGRQPGYDCVCSTIMV